MEKNNKESKGLKRKISHDTLAELRESFEIRAPSKDEFPFDVYDTMDTAEKKFSKIDFEDKIVYIFQLMSPKKNRREALADIEHKIDTTIESYREAIETFANNENHLLEDLKTLETNKKPFMKFLDSIEFACFCLTH